MHLLVARSKEFQRHSLLSSIERERFLLWTARLWSGDRWAFSQNGTAVSTRSSSLQLHSRRRDGSNPGSVMQSSLSSRRPSRTSTRRSAPSWDEFDFQILRDDGDDQEEEKEGSIFNNSHYYGDDQEEEKEDAWGSTQSGPVQSNRDQPLSLPVCCYC